MHLIRHIFGFGFFLFFNPSTTTISGSRNGAVQPARHMQALSFSSDAVEEGLADTRGETNICPSLPVSNYLSCRIPTSNSLNEPVHQTGSCARKTPSSNLCCPIGECGQGRSSPSPPRCCGHWKK